MNTYPKYLVRPSDYHIWEIDESNGCYRSHINRNVLQYSVGTRRNAQLHFTFENLTENYGFFPIDESEIEMYEVKHNEYCDFINWQTRPDGHGGAKGGTYEEYLIYLKNCELNKNNKNNLK